MTLLQFAYVALYWAVGLIASAITINMVIMTVMNSITESQRRRALIVAKTTLEINGMLKEAGYGVNDQR